MIIQKTTESRISTFDPENYSFGDHFIDHMIVCEYVDGKWGDVKLMPYGQLAFSPANMAFNYGQACFEGMKAYKDKDGQVFLSDLIRTLTESINLLRALRCRRLLRKCLLMA